MFAIIDDTMVMNFGKNLQYNFPKMGGGSKAVWNFSENSSVLVLFGIPSGGGDTETEGSLHVALSTTLTMVLITVLVTTVVWWSGLPEKEDGGGGGERGY